MIEYFVRNLSGIVVKFSRYKGLNFVDRLAIKRLGLKTGGVFIEAGANNGVTQSNTYFLEKYRGWSGLLIEPVPSLARQCQENRPNSLTINAALVAPEKSGEMIELVDLDLMSVVKDLSVPNAGEKIIREAEIAQKLTRNNFFVEGKTLSQAIDESQLEEIHFFSLDVEGYELEVLRGLDLSRHKPKSILVETKQINLVTELLEKYYFMDRKLSLHDYLFVLRNIELNPEV